MTQIIICDNDPIFARNLRNEILKLLTHQTSIELCCSSKTLINLCKYSVPQIVLLDINLGEENENGISLAKKLFPSGCGTAVIFISGYAEDYVSDVYETEHVYFLRKPIDPIYLEKALNKAIESTAKTPPLFEVRVHGVKQLIDVRDILCIESFYRKLRIRMWDESIECYGSISALPDIVQKLMINCHKSFLVNPAYIRTIDHQKFLLKDGSTVPISRARYTSSRQAFLDYCSLHL